jgi:hypothetical protein
MRTCREESAVSWTLPDPHYLHQWERLVELSSMPVEKQHPWTATSVILIGNAHQSSVKYNSWRQSVVCVTFFNPGWPWRGAHCGYTSDFGRVLTLSPSSGLLVCKCKGRNDGLSCQPKVSEVRIANTQPGVASRNRSLTLFVFTKLSPDQHENSSENQIHYFFWCADFEYIWLGFDAAFINVLTFIFIISKDYPRTEISNQTYNQMSVDYGKNSKLIIFFVSQENYSFKIKSINLFKYFFMLLGFPSHEKPLLNTAKLHEAPRANHSLVIYYWKSHALIR